MCPLTVTRPVPIVKQELLVLLEHQISFLVFSGDRVVQSSVFCVVFVLLEHQISFLVFSGDRVVQSPVFYWGSCCSLSWFLVGIVLFNLLVFSGDRVVQSSVFSGDRVVQSSGF
jgi:hypothetical protein